MRKSVVTILSFFALVIVQAQPQTKPLKVVADKILGVVGDKIILYSDIQNTIADAARNGKPVPENAECLLMEQALVSKVLMLQAEKDSLPVTEDEVEADLDNRVRQYINVYGSQEALEEIAGKTIYQIKEDARETVKEQKLAEAMQKKIVENVHITPTEVKAFYDRIPKDSLPYYESELEIGQIVIYPKANRDLEKYVIDELNNYKKQVESKLTTFDQLARRFSEDPGSKERGGQYQVNRKEKTWDPAFLAACFRLKEGEISNPVKSKFGYHLIQVVQRIGDDAVIRHILRIPQVTDDEIRQALSKLDSVRAKVLAEVMTFGAAATKFSEDPQAKFAGPYFLSRDGSTYVTIDQLDKDIVGMISKMKVGEFSQPVQFTDETGKKGVRFVHFKSRTEPHRLNMKDDFSKISQMALEEKKGLALEKWLMTRIPTYYIMIDDEIKTCEQLGKWTKASEKAF
ncbi:MAG: peptidylprolyl isomerase [Chitinophagaceae bacterium]|nr:MAG: peptidylprolyl isomerase [Chitinophagaceae bacterium]